MVWSVFFRLCQKFLLIHYSANCDKERMPDLRVREGNSAWILRMICTIEQLKKSWREGSFIKIIWNSDLGIRNSSITGTKPHLLIYILLTAVFTLCQQRWNSCNRDQIVNRYWNIFSLAIQRKWYDLCPQNCLLSKLGEAWVPGSLKGRSSTRDTRWELM